MCCDTVMFSTVKRKKSNCQSAKSTVLLNISLSLRFTIYILCFYVSSTVYTAYWTYRKLRIIFRGPFGYLNKEITCKAELVKNCCSVFIAVSCGLDLPYWHNQKESIVSQLTLSSHLYQACKATFLTTTVLEKTTNYLSKPSLYRGKNQWILV